MFTTRCFQKYTHSLSLALGFQDTCPMLCFIKLEQLQLMPDTKWQVRGNWPVLLAQGKVNAQLSLSLGTGAAGRISYFTEDGMEAKGEQASWWQNWGRNLHLPFLPSCLHPMSL